MRNIIPLGLKLLYMLAGIGIPLCIILHLEQIFYSKTYGRFYCAQNIGHFG
jgi:hypothetical protein